MNELHTSKLFVLLFMMTGPLRVIPAFAVLTRDWDSGSRIRLANRGLLFASIGMLLAVFVGRKILVSWGASPQSPSFGPVNRKPSVLCRALIAFVH